MRGPVSTLLQTMKGDAEEGLLPLEVPHLRVDAPDPLLGQEEGDALRRQFQPAELVKGLPIVDEQRVPGDAAEWADVAQLKVYGSADHIAHRTMGGVDDAIEVCSHGEG